jgi:hypothetical protein
MFKKISLALLALAFCASTSAFAAFYENTPRYEKIMAAPHDTMYLDMDSIKPGENQYVVNCGILTILDNEQDPPVLTNITFYYDPDNRTSEYTIDSFDELNEKGEVEKTLKPGDTVGEKRAVEPGTNMYKLANAVYYIVMGDTFYPDENLDQGKKAAAENANDSAAIVQAVGTSAL